MSWWEYESGEWYSQQIWVPGEAPNGDADNDSGEDGHYVESGHWETTEKGWAASATPGTPSSQEYPYEKYGEAVADPAAAEGNAGSWARDRYGNVSPDWNIVFQPSTPQQLHASAEAAWAEGRGGNGEITEYKIVLAKPAKERTIFAVATKHEYWEWRSGEWVPAAPPPMETGGEPLSPEGAEVVVIEKEQTESNSFFLEPSFTRNKKEVINVGVSLLPVEFRSGQAENDGRYDLAKHDEAIYPRPGRVKAIDAGRAMENALHLFFEDCAEDDQIVARANTRFDLKVGSGNPLHIPGLSWLTVEKPPGAPDLMPIDDLDRLIKFVSNSQAGMRGGLYRYKLDGSSTEGQVWLPLAGPDIAAFWDAETSYFHTTWGPQYRAKLDRRTLYLSTWPVRRSLLKKSLAMNDMRVLGETLDWTNPPGGPPHGNYSPCGGPSDGSFRYTIHGVVETNWALNNMMYALIGREMKIPETVLDLAGDMKNNPLATGSPDTPATKQAYQAGFELHNGKALKDVLRSRGRKMQEPNKWERREWPSWETSTATLVRVEAIMLQQLIE